MIAITARTLETLIRMSTAIAKIHLSPNVEISHCEEAVALLRFAIFAEEQNEIPTSPVAEAPATVAAGSPESPNPRRSTRRRVTDQEQEDRDIVKSRVSPSVTEAGKEGVVEAD